MHDEDVKHHHFHVKSAGFTAEEILEISHIHAAEGSSGFLTSLGSGGLSLLYDHIARSELSFLIAGYDQGLERPIGFVCATLDCSALYKEFLKKNGIRALRLFLPRLLSVERLRKAAETLWYPNRTACQALPKPELINIAIRHPYRGTGLARRLFMHLRDQLHTIGVARLKIVTGANLTHAHAFYERLGAKRAGSMEIHQGEVSRVYVYDLRSKVD